MSNSIKFDDYSRFTIIFLGNRDNDRNMDVVNLLQRPNNIGSIVPSRCQPGDPIQFMWIPWNVFKNGENLLYAYDDEKYNLSKAAVLFDRFDKWMKEVIPSFTRKMTKVTIGNGSNIGMEMTAMGFLTGGFDFSKAGLIDIDYMSITVDFSEWD